MKGRNRPSLKSVSVKERQHERWNWNWALYILALCAVILCVTCVFSEVFVAGKLQSLGRQWIAGEVSAADNLSEASAPLSPSGASTWVNSRDEGLAASLAEASYPLQAETVEGSPDVDRRHDSGGPLTAEPSEEKGSAEKSQYIRRDRTLIVLPRADGFNNQLMTIYEDLSCASQTRTQLVTPLMFEHVVVDKRDTKAWPTGPFSFGDYFNVTRLREFMPARTPTQYFEVCKKVLLNCPENIDGFKNKQITYDHNKPTSKLLGIYREAFGAVMKCAETFVVDESQLEGTGFECAANLTIACDNGVNHKNRRRDWYLDKDETFARVWRMLQLSDKMLAPLNAMRQMLPRIYNCAHYRGADFLSHSARTIADEDVLTAIAQLGTTHLYIMCPHGDIPFVEELLNATRIRQEHFSFFDDYEELMMQNFSWAMHRNDARMLISQHICARAEKFVASPLSTVSQEVFNIRLDNGQPPGSVTYFPMPGAEGVR